MNKLILLLITSLIFSQQLKVDGNLKVEGNIDASGNPITNVGAPQAVTDALNLQTLNNMMTDGAVYEYMFVPVFFNGANNASDHHTQNYPYSTSYKAEGDVNFSNNDFTSYANNLSLEGWVLFHRTFIGLQNMTNSSSNFVTSGPVFIYEFKRPLEQD